MREPKGEEDEEGWNGKWEREHVVHQLHIMVLVHVYLPIQLWSGWQFQRSDSVAGAIFAIGSLLPSLFFFYALMLIVVHTY